MNFLACDGAITDQSGMPVCSTGWFVLTPSQAKTALEISPALTNLSPAEHHELFQGLVLILVVAFGARVLKKMFLPNI
jgi:hypothetical protein